MRFWHCIPFAVPVLSQKVAIRGSAIPTPDVSDKNTDNRNLKSTFSNETFVNGVMTNRIDSWTDDDVINHHLAPKMLANISYVPPKMPPPAVTDKDFNVPEADFQTKAVYHETQKGIAAVVNRFSGLVKNLGAKYNMIAAKWNASDIKDAQDELKRHEKRKNTGRVRTEAESLEGEGKKKCRSIGATYVRACVRAYNCVCRSRMYHP